MRGDDHHRPTPLSGRSDPRTPSPYPSPTFRGNRPNSPVPRPLTITHTHTQIYTHTHTQNYTHTHTHTLTVPPARPFFFAAMKDESLKAGVIADLCLLSTVGIRPVLVHGGGPEINSWLAKVGIEANFKNGLRVTDGPTMDVVEMVLVGRVNKSLVTLINQNGGNAVGLCGKDGRTLIARQMVEKDIGFVGEVTSVNPSVIHAIMSTGSIPVIATVAQVLPT